MTNQIFKSNVPNSILYDFLDKIYLFKCDTYYTISPVSFKKACFLNIIDEFCDKIKNHYHISKNHYINREMNYNRLITVIRQICKYNKIPITSNVKYDKSKYSMQYYIVFN